MASGGEAGKAGAFSFASGKNTGERRGTHLIPSHRRARGPKRRNRRSRQEKARDGVIVAGFARSFGTE